MKCRQSVGGVSVVLVKCQLTVGQQDNDIWNMLWCGFLTFTKCSLLLKTQVHRQGDAMGANAPPKGRKGPPGRIQR